MNKSTITTIKRSIDYQGTPEQKRFLKSFKKKYNALPAKEKKQLIIELQNFFNNEGKSTQVQ